MKKILFLIMLLPIVAFSQVSSWRSNPPREFNRPQQTKPGSNIIINNNPWLWNDWGWGWGFYF